MRIYLIRHADPDYPNNTITAAGHLEARALAVRLKAQGLDRIYSSPLGRALHTMAYTAEALGMEHKVEEWTKELNIFVPETPQEWGFKGAKLMTWDVPGEVIKAKRPLPTAEDWHTRDPFSQPEIRAAVEDVQKNSDEFLARHGYVREGHRYRVVKANRERIAVFCHFGFGITWLAHLLDIPVPLMWSGFWMPPSSVTTVLFDERTPEWATPRVIGMADVSHLHAANLPVQPAGIKANFH